MEAAVSEWARLWERRAQTERELQELMDTLTRKSVELLSVLIEREPPSPAPRRWRWPFERRR